MIMSNEKYLIESMEHTPPGATDKVWWRPDRRGYTNKVAEAGRYSKAEAEEIVKDAGADNEKMWKESEVQT
jgi:hypothetical protein